MLSRDCLCLRPDLWPEYQWRCAVVDWRGVWAAPRNHYGRWMCCGCSWRCSSSLESSLNITGSALISRVLSSIEFLYLGMESCDVDSLEMETDIGRGERDKLASLFWTESVAIANSYSWGFAAGYVLRRQMGCRTENGEKLNNSWCDCLTWICLVNA